MDGQPSSSRKDQLGEAGAKQDYKAGLVGPWRKGVLGSEWNAVFCAEASIPCRLGGASKQCNKGAMNKKNHPPSSIRHGTIVGLARYFHASQSGIIKECKAVSITGPLPPTR